MRPETRETIEMEFTQEELKAMTDIDKINHMREVLPLLGEHFDIPEYFDSDIDTDDAEREIATEVGDTLDGLPLNFEGAFEDLSYEEEENLLDSDDADNEKDMLVIMHFMKTNRIDPARAFLGKQGGYSMRDLKRFFRQTVIDPELRYDQNGKLIEPKYTENATNIDIEAEAGGEEEEEEKTHD